MPRPVRPLQMNPEDVLRLRSMIVDGSAGTAAQILLLRSEGIPQREVAKRLGVSPSTVTRWTDAYVEHGLACLEVVPKRGRPPLSKALIHQIKRVGSSTREAAKITGVSKTTVSRYRRRDQKAISRTSKDGASAAREPERARRDIVTATLRELDAIEQPQGRMLVFAYIKPEAILGFEFGREMKFEAYRELGILVPEDVCGRAAVRQRRLASITSIREGIRRSMSIDDPLLIWRFVTPRGVEEIFLLDGVLRLTAVAIIRSAFPTAFSRVPVMVFTGSKDAAIAESIRRRIGPRSRQTSTAAVIRCVVRHAADGMVGHHLSSAVGISGDDVERLIHLATAGHLKDAAQHLTRALKPQRCSSDVTGQVLDPQFDESELTESSDVQQAVLDALDQIDGDQEPLKDSHSFKP